jgi:shikimate dehydrogenase
LTKLTAWYKLKLRGATQGQKSDTRSSHARKKSSLVCWEANLGQTAETLIESGPTGGPSRSVVVGLVGKDIQLSRTPAMHEAEGRAQGLDYNYRLIDTERMRASPPSLAELLRQAEQSGFAGVNVTYPYKLAALPLVDELSANAAATGSVNTVVFKDGRRIGHNTDLWGFRESFRERLSDVALGTVLLLGAGGAGAAVAQALIQIGVQNLLVRDTDESRSEVLVARLTKQFGAGRGLVVSDVADAASQCDGIVNATPVGMSKIPSTPIPPEILHSGLWVVDIVYFRLETEFLEAARAIGCRTMNGEGMAVFQAVRAFELFTGLKPNTQRMRAAFEAWEPPTG